MALILTLVRIFAHTDDRLQGIGMNREVRMKRKKQRINKRRSRRHIILRTAVFVTGIALAGVVFALAAFYQKTGELEGMLQSKNDSQADRFSPEELLLEYMGHIPKQEYREMYEMLDVSASGGIREEDFILRNSAIYEGIELKDMQVKILSSDKESGAVSYQMSFETSAGGVSFTNEALFLRGEDGCRLLWEDALIFPGLRAGDKVRVSTIQAKRGEIQDRNGSVLAGKGTAVSAGIIPGKLEQNRKSIAKIAKLLQLEPEAVEKKLAAKWVKEDSFVPIQTIPKVKEARLTSLEPDEEALREQQRQEQLLAIPGVMLTDTQVRSYPLGEAAAHLIGYVQGVTAEDLKEHKGEGYTASSMIGRSGMEGLYEKQLRGRNGCRIYIADADGKEREVLAETPVEHGENIRLTIDAGLQKALYQQFQTDKSCSVAMQPYTGEVLALVSTPSYDNNDFILGLSGEKWKALNEDENKPMYNRFRQVWCPGSTFKAVTAAIGLDAGTIDPAEDYGNVGLRWQKDASWGSYYVTTLHAYDPVILENALIYSDNIYFAKAALKTGAETLESSLAELGFGQEVPFEIRMASSQYSNTEHIETEIQLADSGYGQGQMLVGPLHMACLYSAFCNEGNIRKPYLLWQQEAEASYWIRQAFTEAAAKRVLDGMIKVVNDPNGTGYRAHREDVLLAGKTGTAEIKAAKGDTSGTELGWFAVFTAEKEVERPILIVSMTEDVKGRGGSGYVVEKDRQVLEEWLAD